MAIHICEDGSLYTVSEENYGISGIDYLYSEPLRDATAFSANITTPIPVLDYKILLFFLQNTTNGGSSVYTIMGCVHPLYYETAPSSTSVYLLNYSGGISCTYNRTGDYSFSFSMNQNTKPTAANIIGIR
ncbi:MAG: hypothetical protein J6Y02_24210 [Pseudobutyrivibrio sp.]|nr:hypothetical protein [Pseudobutyrivibrio sp.]